MRLFLWYFFKLLSLQNISTTSLKIIFHGMIIFQKRKSISSGIVLKTCRSCLTCKICNKLKSLIIEVFCVAYERNKFLKWWSRCWQSISNGQKNELPKKIIEALAKGIDFDDEDSPNNNMVVCRYYSVDSFNNKSK